ncbi:purine-nucleoside phosphorylase, partial [candidate division KSB3 bacterium]|nr:purine-nucleoside phosphorylase [candidate division KSB3 bacterium]MBD3325636.1 purine-nucleoside phosphorylase [candidate division KSB3 bacterium]
AGDLMLMTDHLNLMGANPLRGSHHPEFGERFPDLTHAYNAEDAQVFDAVAARQGLCLKKGVYAAFSGPSYETPAEIRMVQILGADAVGMSTVPEAIVAVQMGIRVSAVSCITNMAAGITEKALSHQEVIETTERVRTAFIALLNDVIQEFGKPPR